MSILNEFQAYVATTYGGRITENSPDPAVRQQYQDLRDAFFGGAVVGFSAEPLAGLELIVYSRGAAARARAAAAQGGPVH